ncbi:MAG: 1-deoxy-D-xylulose-5-phosphate reductoisomerase [Candidatus Omnitrophica bacterium]|nr:1-deoxy-D-xylulose-5-phosphate reductoisomerase [Candidatus Omnitrophota bacterium]
MKKKRIAILGSTGSIGLNTLEVIRRHPDRFEVVALSALNNVVVLSKQFKEFKPRYVAIGETKAQELKSSIAGNVKIFDAQHDLPGIVARKDVDVVVLAITGAAALDSFLSAAKAGKTIAPANKEALVMAGEIIMKAACNGGAQVIPVDSEQSAIFQCLQGHRSKDIRRVHLTASGGPLKDVPASQHGRLTVQQVLRHPRWQMGAKITVDSATLMNKGFEVIEAQRLFDLTTDQVKVVIHPEAIIHSMVEYRDGSVIAQMGVTDMRIPIQYALSYPKRFLTGLQPLDLIKTKSLTFEAPDLKKFPSLALAYHASREGGSVPAVLNAADEVAVEAFLDKKLAFMSIYKLVEKVVKAHTKVKAPSLKEIKQADVWARSQAAAFMKGLR